MDNPASNIPDKFILVLIDGIGDVTIPAFGDRTPLQVAHTPNMDCIAAAGLNGLVDAVEPGLACGSDTSHMNILGYDPRKYYRGRGAFESMGAGLPMAPGDIAFKSNFATYNPATGIVEKRRADRHFEHLGPTLCDALDGLVLPSFPEHAVAVKYATEHRCGVVVRGPGLSDAISGTDPLKDNLPLLTAEPLDDTPEAAHTAAVVNELSAEIRKVLESHPINKQRIAEGQGPANLVLLRGCGSRIDVASFEQLHGMRACLVAPTKIIAGLGMSFDIDSLDAPGATGSYDSHFASKAAVAANALISGGYDFAMVHVKAVDDTGHDRMLAMKVKFLEVVDLMIGHILMRLHDAEQLQQQQQQQQQQQAIQRYVICVTGDHSTPVVFGDHSHEPVPIAIAQVQQAVAAMGGREQQELRRQYMGKAAAAAATGQLPSSGAQQTEVERIPLPNTKQPPPLEELLLQAEQQQRRRAAAAQGLGFSSSAASLEPQQQRQGAPEDSSTVQQPAAGVSNVDARSSSSSSSSSSSGYGSWPEAWPQVVLGDAVFAFDELTAAKGSLGRFTGAGIMPLVKQFTGRVAAPAAAAAT